ncbi:ATP-binding protein [Bradyrhizobium sp. STM 3562]|uniref:ATP-binding protein n=1 Tax=Bradyrhizobium sp. STM 3562 TaxID=578924 RepID=UPI00388CFC22
MGLLSRLFVLVALSLLPAIGIQSYNEFTLRRSLELQVQEQAFGFAKLAAAQQLQIVEGIREVLIALSELPAIKKKDAAACSWYLSAIQQRYPAFLTFIVVDMNGQSFCGTHGRRVNIAGRTYFAEAVRTGKFTVGEFSIGLSTGRKVVQFALPFYGEDGRMAGVIEAPLSLDWLADFIRRVNIPPGAALAVTDRNGTYLARYPDNDRFVGRKMSTAEASREQGGVPNDLEDADGVERIVGYSSLQRESGGFAIAFGLDKALAFRDIERRTLLGILLIIASTSLVLILTWVGARKFIKNPLQQLIDAANRWRDGDYARRVEIRDQRSEIAGVADAFNSMVDALDERERQLYRAKEGAEKAAARITTIFESATDCVLIIDRDWSISYLNDRAKRRLAAGRQLVGIEIGQALAEDVEIETLHRIRGAMQQQQPTSFETFCVRHGLWYEVSAFPSEEGLIVLFRDVTEQKRAVEARRHMEEQLHQSQKMEAVGQLTGGVAHDFNNLLMVIAGKLELIEECAGNRESIRQLAAAARKAADRGASLTAQLLAFSRRQTLSPKAIYADRLILDFQDFIRHALGQGYALKIQADEKLWACDVDPAQLQTALLNLILNGRDSMPGGGSLEIEALNVELEEQTAGEIAPGLYVKIAVKDKGCGMSPETLERVFEPFFTTKDVGKGTGLGLSMVYGFVRQSSAYVTIDSALGFGTTVSLYLPKSAREPNVEDEAPRSQDSQLSAGRVLLVEDDDDVLDVTSAMLSKLGYEVHCARDGLEAIRLLKGEKKFDLLFTDVVMPSGINGIELAREATRLCNGIKVLLTSGNPADVMARHSAGGEFPIIGKPFRRADLAEYVQRTIDAT